MRTRRLLGVLALVGTAMLALSAIPVAQPVLSLRPSGDPADREDISAGRTAQQRVTLDSGATLTGLEVRLRDPVPRDAELMVTVTQRDQERETRIPLSSIMKATRVPVQIDAFPVGPGAPVEIRIGVRGTPETTLSLATATGVPADFAGALTIGAHERDRHLALTLLGRTTLGSLGLQRVASLRATGVLPDAATLVRTMIGAALGIAAAALLRTGFIQRHFLPTLAFLAMVFVILHAPFRSTYPATNDEGSILMDAQMVRAGDWPGGAKGPVALAALGAVMRVTGASLLAARGLVEALGAAVVVLLGILGRRVWGVPAGALAALFAATLPAAHAQSAQVFLQSFSLPLVLGALVFITTPTAPSPRRALLRDLGAGVLFALAVLARQTSLAFVPIALGVVAIETHRRGASLRRALAPVARRAGACLGGFLLVVLITAAWVLPLLGPEKTLDFFGWQGAVVAQQRRVQLAPQGSPAASSVGPVAPAREGTTGTPLLQILRNGWPVILGGAPLLVLSLAFLVKAFGDLVKAPAVGSAAVSAFVLLALVSAGQNLLTVPSVPAFAPLALGITLLTVVGVLIVLPRLPRIAHPGRDLLLLAGSWIALTVGYAQYGRFRQHYHAEFLPLYLLAGAALLGTLVVSRKTGTQGPASPYWPLTLLLAGIGAFTALAYPVVLTRHHAGSIPLSVVSAVVDDLQRRTAPGEEIFTAQVLFPVLADRTVPFRISHPGWYREEMFGVVPTELRRRYYPDRDVLRAYLQERPVRVAVVERRTREVFLEFDPKLKELLESHYERVRIIENPLLDAIEIWQWKAR